MRQIERINLAIEASGVSVQDVAKACDISIQAVYKWRRGEVAAVEAEHLFAVADLTGFDPRWLATGSGSDRRINTPRLRALIDNYLTADERGRASVERAAEQECRYTIEPEGKHLNTGT